jgi:NTE family protein
MSRQAAAKSVPSAQAGPPMPRPVFAIFEGGGAKGIAHIGAAEAALNEGLEFIGLAGAFVAALLAAGYRGTELFNPQARGSDLLARRNQGPTDLLGANSWASFQKALVGCRRLLKGGVIGGYFGAWLCGPRTLGILRKLVRNKGHFETTGVREFVNDSLRARLVELFAGEGLPAADVPERIRFADLDYRRFKQLRPLKIVATDVQDGKAVLFRRRIRRRLRWRRRSLPPSRFPLCFSL